MRYFVFVDMPYDSYVADPIEADSLEAAQLQAAEGLRPGDETIVYVVPEDAVTAIQMSGPKRAPVGLLKLQQEQNRFWQSALAAKHGGYSVRVEAGSTSV